METVKNLLFGKPLFWREDSIFYASVELGGATFRVREFVKIELKAEDGSFKEKVARIETIFVRSESVYTEVRWFHNAQEYICKANGIILLENSKFDKNELIASSDISTVSLFSISQKVKVVIVKPNQRKNRDTLFTRYTIDLNYGVILPYFESKSELYYSVCLQMNPTLAKEYIPDFTFYCLRSETKVKLDYIYQLSQQFFVKTLPKYLIGREDQAKLIETFLKKSVLSESKRKKKRKKNETFSVMTKSNRESILALAAYDHDNFPGVMTIVGMPGTGKTLTVVTVLHRLHFQALKRKLPAFKVIFINCFKHKTSYDIFKKLYENLSGIKFESSGSRKKATVELINACEKYLFYGKPNSDRFVLVIDEIDEVFKSQDRELLRLFIWPFVLDRLNSKGSLVIIAISNLFDLFEKYLFPTTTKIAKNRLSFETYTTDMMKQIIVARLKEMKWDTLFTSQAISLCSSACSKVLGDYRYARQIWQFALKQAKTKLENKLFVTKLDLVVDHIMVKEAIKYIQSATSLITKYRSEVGNSGIFLLYVLSKLCEEKDEATFKVVVLIYKIETYLNMLKSFGIQHTLPYTGFFEEYLERQLYEFECLGLVEVIVDNVNAQAKRILEVEVCDSYRLCATFKNIELNQLFESDIEKHKENLSNICNLKNTTT